MTQSPSPGTIYASPSGGRESSSSYPVPSNDSPKRELGSPGIIKRESGPRDDSDQAADRSSVVTRRSSTAYPDACNDELKPEDEVGGPQRKKQKRNKPTLSCFECVERKTKVSLPSSANLSLIPPTTMSALHRVLFLLPGPVPSKPPLGFALLSLQSLHIVRMYPNEVLRIRRRHPAIQPRWTD